MLRHFRIATGALFLSAFVLTSCVNTQKKTAKVSKLRHLSAFQRVEELPAITSDQKIMQELTGKSDVKFSQADLKKQPLPVQHLFAGEKAAQQKKYIMAIKHFNTVIKKYPRSAEMKKALVAKSNMYKEMGLSEPSQLNMSLARSSNLVPGKKKNTKISVNRVSPVNEKLKTTK